MLLSMLRSPSTRVTVASRYGEAKYPRSLARSAPDVRIGYVDDMRIDFQLDSRGGEFVDNVISKREKSADEKKIFSPARALLFQFVTFICHLLSRKRTALRILLRFFSCLIFGRNLINFAQKSHIRFTGGLFDSRRSNVTPIKTLCRGESRLQNRIDNRGKVLTRDRCYNKIKSKRSAHRKKTEFD